MDSLIRVLSLRDAAYARVKQVLRQLGRHFFQFLPPFLWNQLTLGAVGSSVALLAITTESVIIVSGNTCCTI